MVVVTKQELDVIKVCYQVSHLNMVIYILCFLGGLGYCNPNGTQVAPWMWWQECGLPFSWAKKDTSAQQLCVAI